MKKVTGLTLVLLIFVLGLFLYKGFVNKNASNIPAVQKKSYWLILYRKANIEFLYFGQPGKIKKSKLVKKFKVKTGIPGERPTPLPKLLGKEYWLITDKTESKDNPETSPYFLTLNIPAPGIEPFGPTPYLECKDPVTGKAKQCNWILPGAFGLHGSGGDKNRLSEEDPGSSGCIRHLDDDITYLYNLLNPKKQPIRYYIEDI